MNDRNSEYFIASSMHDNFDSLRDGWKRTSVAFKNCIENKLAGNKEKKNNSKIVESIRVYGSVAWKFNWAYAMNFVCMCVTHT